MTEYRQKPFPWAPPPPGLPPPHSPTLVTVNGAIVATEEFSVEVAPGDPNTVRGLGPAIEFRLPPPTPEEIEELAQAIFNSNIDQLDLPVVSDEIKKQFGAGGADFVRQVRGRVARLRARRKPPPRMSMSELLAGIGAEAGIGEE